MPAALKLPPVLAGKRLLVVGVRWPAETFIARKLRALAHAGVEVIVAANAGPGARHLVDDGIQVVRLPGPLAARELVADVGELVRTGRAVRRAARTQAPRGRLERLMRLRRFAALGQLRPDLVHFEWNAAAVDYLPLVDVWRCPFVVSCRGAQVNVRAHVPGYEAYLAGLRQVFARAAGVHCVSAAIRDEAIPLGLRPETARVITPAVPHEEFVPLAPAERTRAPGAPFEVISIGTLEWRKANELALAAFRRLVDAGVDARYTIIGDGPDRLRVLYTIADLGLGERVAWLGKQPPEVVRARLQRADALLLTSYSEGIANVALEAMACGVPAVTSASGGMREAVRDGVDGLVVPVADLPATSAALLRLARDPALAARLGAAARARVVERFTLEQQLDGFVALYADVLARETRPS